MRLSSQNGTAAVKAESLAAAALWLPAAAAGKIYMETPVPMSCILGDIMLYYIDMPTDQEECEEPD